MPAVAVAGQAGTGSFGHLGPHAATTGSAPPGGSSCHSVERTETVYAAVERNGKEEIIKHPERVSTEVCATAGPAPKLVPVGATAGSWRLVFDDEFGGASLDGSKWSVCFAWGCTPNNAAGRPPVYDERETYDAANCQVSGGELLLTATSGSAPLPATPGQPAGATGATGASNGGGGSGPSGATGAASQGAGSAGSSAAAPGTASRPYRSCLIQTGSTKLFEYGYFEARMYLPADADAWPAFWLVGAADQRVELDVLESFRGTDWVTQNVHWAGGAAGNAVLLPWATSGWNTYAIAWEPGSVTWYVDGAEVWQVTGEQVPHRPAEMVLDLAVDSFRQHATVPASLRVDYVRVWHRTGPTSSSPAG
jgi:hypothetical protein